MQLCDRNPEAATCPRRYAYPITCTSFSTDAAGQVTELAAEYDADFRAQQKKPPKVWHCAADT